MKNVIYYFSGTGNSLWVAQLLANELGKDNTKLIPMANLKKQRLPAETKVVGLVFPVHVWGVPKLVLNAIKKLEDNQNRYFFAAAVNAGQVSRTLIQLKSVLKSKNIKLSAGFDFALPSNYIPWGGPGPVEKQQEKFDLTKKKAQLASKIIVQQKTAPIEKGPLWQRIIFTPIYHLHLGRVAKEDSNFSVDDNCDGCKICAKVCPVNNIEIINDEHIWKHHCEQCLACLQWCPKNAIQYGKKTSGYLRYHNPNVKLKDMLVKN